MLALGCLIGGGVTATPASSAPVTSAAAQAHSATGTATGTGSADGWVLSTGDTSKNYAPTFVGNGYLAARVPAAGEGFSSSPVVTQSELAGFYGAPAGQFERRASLPTWTTLGFGRSGGVYGVPGNWSCAFDQICPARDGQISGGAFVETSHGGSVAGGYLAGLNTDNIPTVGGTDSLTVRDAPAGPATVDVRYANGSGGPQTVHLGVNGTLQQLTLPDSGGWDSWAVAKVPVTLTAGSNTLQITVAQGDTARVNVDYLAPYPAGGQPPTGIAPATTGTTSGYRQSLDLRTGTLTTSFDWTSPDGDRTSFVYTVDADRAQGHLGTVDLRAVPHWSGTAGVVDEFDGQGLDHATATAWAVDAKNATLTQTVATDGNLVTAALNSVLRIGGHTEHTTALTVPADGSAGQSATLAVRAGQTYEITKYVGVASSVDTDRPLKAATPQQAAARTAARAADDGYRATMAANDSAWAALWQSDISVPGDSATTAQIRASMFYLLASMRAGVTWSTSPGGLSSDGYNGHVFWDMETWMYPALLAQHPDIAQSADTYRQKLLPAAEAAAAALSTPAHPVKGAKFPWESSLTGKETIPPGNNEGNDEIHIDSDIALAQWQYYQASGDTAWLKDKAWPVLKDIADYWATRAVPDAAGGYDIDDVQGADEYHDHVDNSASTDAGAQASLRIAVRAAALTGHTPDPAWTTVADGLKIPVDTAAGIHPEFDGYSGQQVKQADVTLLQYPWAVPMPAGLAQSDLDYYTQHTDPDGPSMTDAIATIDAAALGSPGCTAYDHLRASADPFIAAPFDQFHETRSGGAFTFTTGEGGYLQQFLYGFTGLRWGTDAVTVDPFLPQQLPGVNITGLKWHGRTFDVSVGQATTTLTLRSGPPLAVRDGNGTLHTVTPGRPLHLTTRHPAATGGPAICSTPVTAAAGARCIDISGGNPADGTALQLYDCNASAAQTWSLPGDGTVRAMAKCMDVRGGSSADGTPVQIYTCNSSVSQQWTYDRTARTLTSGLGKCLTAASAGTTNGTRLVIEPCQGTADQQWTIPS
ncbi:ricin-type beta-trefoil lectin domain protein [Actinacidiphila acidipaludis]|uniref:Ricin-type beta-trefoil lectin domain protein n=1 Tax=Actinacidiphila acidipaludis TaxID=2873382 RepID=A0ABS7QGV9_9ACTN|nr:ricin-type beta-trefoil lectin domain protein [Streptomyces acidipaludis]MBY8882410.1 ricin-type beta-trefoil lectin domain protein [Streptomyces acidipaludis]